MLQKVPVLFFLGDLVNSAGIFLSVVVASIPNKPMPVGSHIP